MEKTEAVRAWSCTATQHNRELTTLAKPGWLFIFKEKKMNDMMSFDFQGSKVRTILINDDPWWVLKDVCDVLDIVNPGMVASRLEEDEKDISQIDTLGGKQSMIIINESGLYSVILRSDKPESKLFKRWVTSEVLPSIRKTGAYSMHIPKTLPDALRAYATAIEEKEEIERKLLEAKPKVDFYNTVTGSKDTIDIGEAAKMLAIPGYGRNRLFEFLRRKGVLQSNNQPYQRFIDRGYFRTIETAYIEKDGTQHINIKTVVYQKGLEYIKNLIEKGEN